MRVKTSHLKPNVISKKPTITTTRIQTELEKQTVFIRP
jgi:hypothetical protein